jgi:hypothetical protein
MPEVKLCSICKKHVDKEKEEYVVVGKETVSAPERLAHALCQQREKQEIRDTSRNRGGSWMSE